MSDDIFVAKDDIDGTLMVLGNEYYLDGRVFEIKQNNYHKHSIHLVGDAYDRELGTFPSFKDASIVYNLACNCDTLSDVRHIIEHKSEELVVNGWVVYLLHFNQKIANHAHHYIGATGNLSRRLQEQARAYPVAAKIVQHLIKSGGSFEVANLWRCESKNEAFELERKLKKRKESPRLCAVCNLEKEYGYG